MIAEVAMQPDTYYTPERIESLLRRLPFLLDHQPKDIEDVPDVRNKRTSAGGWTEDQMVKRADIEAAEKALFDHSPKQYQIVYLTCIGDKSLRDVSNITQLSYRQVRQGRRNGLELMAKMLGWEKGEEDEA